VQATEDITQLLLDWSKDDRSAADKLMPLVYDERRRLARVGVASAQTTRSSRPRSRMKRSRIVGLKFFGG
jgi:hypothetical protein